MNNHKGFTIIEVLVAVLVLSIGVLGLATTAALVTRMIGQGERYSQASTMAAEQFEVLRSQRCTALTSGTATQSGFTLTWTVQNAAGGRARTVTIEVLTPTVRGTRADTFATTIGC